MDGAAIRGMVRYERKWCQSNAMGVANRRGEAYRDVVFEVLLLDRRYAHVDDGRFTQGDMSLRVHDHDSERRRYERRFDDECREVQEGRIRIRILRQPL
jgi:hypothetical protein